MIIPQVNHIGMQERNFYMRILYIKLVNFIGIYASRGLKEVEYDFSNITKPIIQIHGPNRSGKTVLIQQLHPFSSINLSGDERSDLSLILPNEIGTKNIVYEFNGDMYNICHTYKPTSSGNHIVSSSIKKNGEELNSNGGVNTFNQIINSIFGINKYTFQFMCNGTQLTSFASMTSSQRKTLLNKAMGIDIYDKIHKLSTDDYRYTSKLISSLNNSKEYILSTYGSFESLTTFLNNKKEEFNGIEKDMNETKSKMDVLQGKLSTYDRASIQNEINECERLLDLFKSVENVFGSIDNNTYESVINQQLKMNNELNELKNKQSLLLQEIDTLYAKRDDIENTIRTNRQRREDYNEMLQTKTNITNKINSLYIPLETCAPSSYYTSMLSIAKLINNMCREISTSLNSNHLELMTKMICQDIDVSAFIIQEGSLLMNSEKERDVISRIQSMINTINGEFYDKCEKRDTCVYWKTYDTLTKYFKASQNQSDKKFTSHDIEQFDYAYKQVIAIKRLISQSSITNDLIELFNIKRIITNVQKGEFGVDEHVLSDLIESAIVSETKVQLISQLSSIDKQIELMKDVINTTDDVNDTLNKINTTITDKNNSLNDIRIDIDMMTQTSVELDKKRLMLSQIQHVNISDTNKRYQKQLNLMTTLNDTEQNFNELSNKYASITIQYNSVKTELKTLQDAYDQYVTTAKEISELSKNDDMYRIIAEATSSTKGKPVLAIREEVEHALFITNRLLDVIYDGEIEMLKPTINDSEFTLPFRTDDHSSPDIRYGSQSEACLLSVALSLALASSLTNDMVPLIDEIDAPLDVDKIASYADMLSKMMVTLNCEQCFVISHHMNSGFNQNIETVDITK